jgi:hypothetical protein
MAANEGVGKGRIGTSPAAFVIIIFMSIAIYNVVELNQPRHQINTKVTTAKSSSPQYPTSIYGQTTYVYTCSRSTMVADRKLETFSSQRSRRCRRATQLP